MKPVNKREFYIANTGASEDMAFRNEKDAEEACTQISVKEIIHVVEAPYVEELKSKFTELLTKAKIAYALFEALQRDAIDEHGADNHAGYDSYGHRLMCSITHIMSDIDVRELKEAIQNCDTVMREEDLV